MCGSDVSNGVRVQSCFYTGSVHFRDSSFHYLWVVYNMVYDLFFYSCVLCSFPSLSIHNYSFFHDVWVVYSMLYDLFFFIPVIFSMHDLWVVFNHFIQLIFCKHFVFSSLFYSWLLNRVQCVMRLIFYLCYLDPTTPPFTIHELCFHVIRLIIFYSCYLDPTTPPFTIHESCFHVIQLIFYLL